MLDAVAPKQGSLLVCGNGTRRDTRVGPLGEEKGRKRRRCDQQNKDGGAPEKQTRLRVPLLERLDVCLDSSKRRQSEDGSGGDREIRGQVSSASATKTTVKHAQPKSSKTGRQGGQEIKPELHSSILSPIKRTLWTLEAV